MLSEPRFEIRAELRSDPRFVRHEAFDRQLECEVMIERPGAALAGELNTTRGARFLREARMLARIRHPNVVRLREVDVIDRVPALVLDLPTGEPLDAVLEREGRLGHQRIVQLGRDLAQAAQAVHAEGVVHRGIAPENVFLAPGADRAQLAGFTFAKLLDKRTGQTSLDHGRRVSGKVAELGLPTYAAPEQVSGAGADHRADVFALGCLLYRAATGREAFRPESVDFAQPPPVHAVVQGFPRRLSALIAQCLAHAPSQRLPNMLTLDEALAALQQQPAASPRRWRAVLGVAAGLALVAAVLGLSLPSRQPDWTVRGPVEEPAEDRLLPHLSPRYARSFALVIGTDYADNPHFQQLGTAERDAAAVAARLQLLGWQVTSLLGPRASAEAILEGLSWLENEASGDDDQALVYFAGHGLVSSGDEFFVLPADAGPEFDERRNRRGWIDSTDLRHSLRTIRAKHALLVLDCCQSGAFRGRGVRPARDRPRPYALDKSLRMKARWLLTSTLHDELAQDGAGHSPFAAGFLHSLGAVDPEHPQGLFEVFAAVRRSITAAEARQVPWLKDLGSAQSGEFFFLAR